MKKRNRGFTLAELLIVVAIIAVLVAISIPIFSAQLEKAREAVDLANVRTAYGIWQTSVMMETFPDGKKEKDGRIAYYVYTTSGTFEPKIIGTPFELSKAYRIKSKNVDFPDFVTMEPWSVPNVTTGWKDYIIVVHYTDLGDSPVVLCIFPDAGLLL